MVTKNGKSYCDSYAKIVDITNNSFSVLTRYKSNLYNIKHIAIGFFEGNGAHISISGRPVRMSVKDDAVQYRCEFAYSSSAEKYLNIHKPKDGAGHPFPMNKKKVNTKKDCVCADVKGDTNHE